MSLTTVLTKLWKILTYDPVKGKKKPWHWKLFHRLYMWATIILLSLSLQSWLHAPVKFGGNIENPPDSLSELQQENNWLYNSDGLTCTDTTTGELFKC